MAAATDFGQAFGSDRVGPVVGYVLLALLSLAAGDGVRVLQLRHGCERPGLVRTVKAPERVLTLSDFAVAGELGVRFSGPGGEGTVRNDVLGAYAQPAVEWPARSRWWTGAELSEPGQARGKIVLQIG